MVGVIILVVQFYLFDITFGKQENHHIIKVSHIQEHEKLDVTSLSQ